MVVTLFRSAWSSRVEVVAAPVVHADGARGAWKYRLPRAGANYVTAWGGEGTAFYVQETGGCVTSLGRFASAEASACGGASECFALSV